MTIEFSSKNKHSWMEKYFITGTTTEGLSSLLTWSASQCWYSARSASRFSTVTAMPSQDAGELHTDAHAEDSGCIMISLDIQGRRSMHFSSVAWEKKGKEIIKDEEASASNWTGVKRGRFFSFNCFLYVHIQPAVELYVCEVRIHSSTCISSCNYFWNGKKYSFSPCIGHNLWFNTYVTHTHFCDIIKLHSKILLALQTAHWGVGRTSAMQNWKPATWHHDDAFKDLIQGPAWMWHILLYFIWFIFSFFFFFS